MWGLGCYKVCITFDQFQTNKVVPKSVLPNFVALIPKISSPLALFDFRPISLLGTLYKILSKVLARRLTGVMNYTISPSQSAFLKIYNLVGGVLPVSEIVDFVKKKPKINV